MNLEATRVAELLPGTRWFGHTGRTIADARVLDHAILAEGDPAVVLVLLELDIDGETVHYHLPLLAGGDGHVRDALTDPGSLTVLGELMAHGRTVAGESGSFVFGGAGLDPSAPPGGESLRAVGAEQSNSSLIFDEKIILKLFRRIEPGPNPDLELNRVLTAEGFPHIAVQVGDISYEGEDGDVYNLGLAQTYLADARDGWAEIVDQVRSLYDQADEADANEDIDFLVSERSAESLASIAELGDATAEMHVVLSRETVDPDLAPEPVEHEDLKSWIADIQAILDSSEEREPPEVAALAPELGRLAERAGSVAEGGMKTRIHGDYHLGQVLLTGRGWVITDFEGEPARPLKVRRAKSSPLRDVAGMLRSFGYASVAPLLDRATPGTPEWDRLEAWARAWEAAARTRFVDSYVSKAHEGRFLPEDRDDTMALLDLFELEKVLYEVGYELVHRPDWVRIPLHGLARLAERADG